MLLTNKKIAIIGGGPGGLTLARLLQNQGADVHVYERDESRNVRVQGATLDLHFDTGLRALDAAGLLDAFKAKYRPDNDRYRVVDKNAVIFYDDHTKESTGDFGDEWFRPEIDRGPLRDILLDSLQPGTVIWDSHIISLEPVDCAWKIIFQNGKTVIADLVVGADGANSKIRPAITPVKPVYSGVTYLVGNIPDSEKNAPGLHNLLKGGKISGMGDCKTIFLSAKGDGSMDVYFGFKASVNWARESRINFKNLQDVLEWFKNEYAGWDNIWLELFNSDETEFTPRPLFGMPADQCWESQPNVTLLGDAAHLLPPNGEGVNMAMLDALELSKTLTSGDFTDLKSAITCYEKEMLARFVGEEEDTTEMIGWMHAPDGLEKMIKLTSQQPD